MYSMLAYGQGTRERERVEFWTYLGGIIITPRNSHIPPNLYTPHALRMASQSMQTSPPLDIPYAESVVAGAGDGDRPVGEDFDTADGGGMAGEGVDALAKKSCADQHVVGGGGEVGETYPVSTSHTLTCLSQPPETTKLVFNPCHPLTLPHKLLPSFSSSSSFSFPPWSWPLL